jgi:8-oxo-dGTP diphosphatase
MKRDSNWVRVVAGAIERDGCFLLGKRGSKSSGNAGHWEFPGGKVESRESDEEALARELLEELAIEVRVGRRVGEAWTADVDLAVHLILYHCEILSGEPIARVHEAVAWSSPEAFAEFDLGAADRTIAGALLRSLDAGGGAHRGG